MEVKGKGRDARLGQYMSKTGDEQADNMNNEGGIRTRGRDWKSFSASMPTFQKEGKKLFRKTNGEREGEGHTTAHTR